MALLFLSPVCVLLCVCWVSEGMLLGGQTPIKDLGSSEVTNAASFAVENLNKYSDSDKLIVLVSVEKGTSQVVAGVRYRLVLKVGTSSVCKKQSYLYRSAVSPIDCPVDQNSVHEVFTDVWRKPSNPPKYTLNEIKLYTQP